MKRAFALTVLLLGVIAAMLLLREQASRHPIRKAALDAGAPASPSPKGTRVVALKRLLPRYALSLSAASRPAGEAALAGALGAHGGTSVARGGGLLARVPHVQWKPFLKALRGAFDGGALRLSPRGERAQEGEATIEIDVDFDAP